MSFFDDEPDATQTPAAPPRRRRNRSHLRIQRLVIFFVVLFVVVFAAALLFRACQQSAKESAYRSYFTGVQQAISDSKTVGTGLQGLMSDPTKYSRQQLKAKLQSLSDKQKEIYDRVLRLKVPKKLKSLNPIVAQGMYVRWRGAQLVQEGLLAAMGGKKPAATAAKLAALAGYFSGPDVYYTELYQKQAQDAMSKDGVNGVAVPVSNFFVTHPFLNETQILSALQKVQGSAKLQGIHGVGLISTVVGDKTLSTTKETQVKATAGMTFTVTLQNQGDVAESNIPVKLVYTPPSGSPTTLTATVPSLASNAKTSVQLQGINIPSDAISKPQTVKVTVGPVSGETLTSNNSATYTIIPVL